MKKKHTITNRSTKNNTTTMVETNAMVTQAKEDAMNEEEYYDVEEG